MTEDRKEPTLSPLKPDQDEIVHHRQRTAGGNARPRTGASGSQRAATGSHRPVVVRSKLAPFAFLLALTGLGLAGYAYWQLLETQKANEAALARISELESRLEMTGDESEASMAAMQAKLKWADSEIRKLWGVAYDTNRKAIATNQESIASVRQSVTNLDNKLSSAVGEVRNSVANVRSTVESQQQSVNEVKQANQRIQRQTQEVAESFSDIRETQSALQGRVRTNEQAIESIDTFRRTVNRDILELKNQATASPGP